MLFIGTLAADRAAYRGDFGLPGWVISGSADAARQILTAIAAAIITVVGVVFSIILVTLTLASTQFGPRMLRNFIRDRGTQLTLGTFVATFVYAVLVLASIGTGSHGDFVPHISVTVTLGLMVVDLAVLIYFIHHTAVSIQLPQVIASIAADLADGDQGAGQRARPGPDRRPARPRWSCWAGPRRAGPCCSPRSAGTCSSSGTRTWSGWPPRADAVISLEHRPGHFIVRGHRFATVWPPGGGAAGPAGLGRAHIIGPHRTLTQDVSFGIDQLVEIALRALSAAVNDTFTAMTCIDWLGENLCKIVSGWHPARVHRDAGGYIRVIAAEPGLRPAGAAGVREDQGVQPGHARGHDPRAGSAGADHGRDDLRRPAPGAARSGRDDRPGQRAVGARGRRPGRHPAALRGHLDHGVAAGRARGEQHVAKQRAARVGNGAGPFVELVRMPSWHLPSGNDFLRETMEAHVKYVILLLNTEAAQNMSEAEGQAWYAEIGAWYEKGGGGSGKLIDAGSQLAPPATAKTVRAGGVTDGPFMETKEALGGYSVLETDTIEEAVEIAQTWPGVDRGWMTVEVRPLLEM